MKMIIQLILYQTIPNLKILKKDCSALSKQQALDSDRKAIQQINFTANLDHAVNTGIQFILEEEKEAVLDFSQGTAKVL